MHVTKLRLALVMLLPTLVLPANAIAQEGTGGDGGDPDSDTPSIRLEIVDVSNGSRDEVLRITLPLAGDRPASVEARAGDAIYDVSVRREREHAARARGRRGADRPEGDLLFVEIRRTYSGSDGERNVHLRATVRVRKDSKATVARLQRPGGRRTDVIATLQ